MINIRKVFLENLPRGGGNRAKNKINWESSLGYNIKFIYDNIEGIITIIEYIGDHKLKILYNEKEFIATTTNLIHCQLSKIIGRINSDFRLQINQNIVTDTKNITILDRTIRTTVDKKGIKRNYKYYKIQCNKCNNIKWVEEYHLLSRQQHPSCCIKNISKAILGINTIWDTDKWMIPYVGEEIAKAYTRCSPMRIYPICPHCGQKYKKTLNIYNIYTHKGISCNCQDGIKYPNKFGFNLLKQLNVKFINEYSPKWIKPKSYDFYFKLNDKEYIIEMDGGFHNKDNEMSGQTAEESKMIDDEKDKLAKEHGIEVIRIDCDYRDISKRFNYIKQNILENNKLNELFDLSKIDWLKAEEFSLSNQVKMACEYKRNNPNLTTGQIGKLMGHSKGIIRVWLMTGHELGWCKYDSEKEKHMSGKISASAKFKPTICLNNGFVFESAKECSEKSLELFGVHIDKTCIGEVCRGKRKLTKGFSFKHISDLTTEEYIKYDIENKLKELHNKDLVQAC